MRRISFAVRLGLLKFHSAGQTRLKGWLRCLGGGVLACCLGGCITIETSTMGDIDAEKRVRSTYQDVIEAANAAVEDYEAQASIASSESTLVQQSEALFADAVARQLKYFSLYRQAIRSEFFAPEDDKARVDLMQQVEPQLIVVNSDVPMAVGFPNGKIFVSRATLDAEHPAGAKPSAALMGVFFHEITHVKDGHVLDQWAHAAGRRKKRINTALSALAASTRIIPFFTYKNTYRTGKRFEATDKYDQLVEFAADHGAYALLVEAGEDGDAYIDYLKRLHRFFDSSESAGPKNAPVALSERIQCLDRMLRPEPGSGAILLDDESRKVFMEPMATYDRADQLVRRGISRLCYDAVRAIQMRTFNHLGCAIESVFDLDELQPDKPVNVDFFDISLFLRYMIIKEPDGVDCTAVEEQKETSDDE